VIRSENGDFGGELPSGIIHSVYRSVRHRVTSVKGELREMLNGLRYVVERPDD
jgi:hypothetical protein